MKQIAIASLIATSAISFLSEDDLIDTWKETIRFNRVA